MCLKGKTEGGICYPLPNTLFFLNLHFKEYNEWKWASWLPGKSDQHHLGQIKLFKIIQHSENGERNQKLINVMGFFYYIGRSTPVLLIMVALLRHNTKRDTSQPKHSLNFASAERQSSPKILLIVFPSGMIAVSAPNCPSTDILLI